MKILPLMLVGLVLAGCSREVPSKAEPEPSGPVVKVRVLQSGKILLDGAEATIEQVEQRFVQLASEGGTVWYYREGGQQDPPAEGMQVIRLVADNRLPISFSTKPDFSDAVGQDGRSHPRR